MKDLFFRDILTNITFTWDKLIGDIKAIDQYNPYCFSDNYYIIFKHIIVSMLFEKEIILLDHSFAENELKELTGFTSFNDYNKKIEPYSNKLNDKQDLLEHLKNTAKSWKLSLFTSGTTGIPKKVTHNFSTITRHVKYSAQSTGIVWGFAYNPTHMAGVQVFMQALLNGNSIIRLFELHREEIFNEISENKITHISATPTFYRLLLPCNRSFLSVIRLTFGGEKMSQNLAERIKKVFPSAKITNVYASTEAGTLFASDNDVFTINPANEHLIKIENDELLIHKSLLGEYQNDQDEWYRTGDLVEFISLTPLRFRFVSRSCEMINVGGYKVNPTEVEEVLQRIEGIRDARVFPRASSVMGNIVCCEVVKDDTVLTEPDIRKLLREELQEFKIPRIINFVDQISATRTGKAKRNSS